MNKTIKKIKLLSDVVRDMRTLADSLQALCDAADQSDLDTEQTRSSEPEAPKPIDISLEQLRAVLADKSRNGMTSEVRELINRYGAEKLSEIKPENFTAVLKEAEALGNG